jgi:hypothetical protein
MKPFFCFFLLFSVLGTSCTPYLHTVHTPIIPLVTKKHQLVTTGSLDLAGGTAEVQYKPSASFGLAAAIQGHSDELLGGGNVFSGSNQPNIFRNAWELNLGANYLLHAKGSAFSMPLCVGFKNGYTNQKTVELDNNSYDFQGWYGTPYAQTGFLLTGKLVQLYGGYEIGLLRYPNPRTTLLALKSYQSVTQSFISQISLIAGNRSVFRWYLVVNSNSKQSESSPSYISSHPAVNFGMGYGININARHTKAQKIE